MTLGKRCAGRTLKWTLSRDHKDQAKVQESLAHIQRAIDLAGPLDELLHTRAFILFESGRREDPLGSGGFPVRLVSRQVAAIATYTAG